VQVTGNLVSGARTGGIVGLEWEKVVSTDLAADAGRFPHLAVANNVVR
jgi:hypothetical protein